MALLFIDSFDHYDNPHILAKWTSNFVLSSLAAGKGRCGTTAMKMGGSINDLYKGVPFGSLTGTVGFAMIVISQGTLANSVINTASFGGSSASPHLYLYYHAVDGSLSVEVQTGPVVIVGQTVPGVIQQDRYYFIEWQVTIGGAGVGAVIVRVNNVVVLTATGVNTIGYNSPGDLRSVGFHCGSNESWLLDDLYILDSTGPAPNNTFLGDCRVEYLRPRADSSPQQWTPVGGTLTHWRNVDDNATPDDDGTYVEANAAGLTDQNVYMPTGLPAGPIFGAQLNLLAKKSEAGPRVIAPVVNGTPTAPNYAPSYETYQYFSTLYPTNPATGLPWTIAEINAVQLGVTVVS